MRKTRIFKIGVGIFIALLLIFSSGIVTAGDTKTFGNDFLMKRIANKIPEKIKNEIPELEDFYPEDAPDWADGWYLGFWFDKDGDEYTLLGYMAGFYHKWNSYNGYYAGVWNTTDNTTVGAMQGIAFGMFTFGRIILSEENTFFYSGFLLKNETHYLGRIMAFVGDPVYMYGIHQPLT
jgi:hypothetical protein